MRLPWHVEPVVPDALPKCAIGHNLVALTSWFHYGLGIPISQVVSILQVHLHTKLTPGGDDHQILSQLDRVSTIEF